jgi:hypothetical protein
MLIFQYVQYWLYSEAKGLLAYFCFHTAFMYPDTPTADMVAIPIPLPLIALF